MSVKVTLNKSRVKQRIQNGISALKEAVTEQIDSDIVEYEPRRTGALIETKQVNPKEGTITYTQPYSKKVWNGEGMNFSHDKNKKATHHWIDEAKREYGEDWNIVAQNAFKKGMK